MTVASTKVCQRETATTSSITNCSPQAGLPAHHTPNPGTIYLPKMSIDKLPNELLVHIFSFVPCVYAKLACRQVGRRWRACSDDRRAWVDIRALQFDIRCV